MSTKERDTVNRAVEEATEEAPYLRERDMDRLELIRESVDINTHEIDDALDKPSNWYANRVREGEKEHEFTLTEFRRVQYFLQMVAILRFEENYIDKDVLKQLVDEGAVDREVGKELLTESVA